MGWYRFLVGWLGVALLSLTPAVSGDSTATLRISTEPGEAELRIDGEPYGISPQRTRDTFMVRLPPGTYAIEAKIPAEDTDHGEPMRAEREVTLRADTEQTFHLTLSGPGDPLASYREHRDAVRAVASLPDGRVLTASADRRIKLWRLEDGQVLRTYPGHAAAVNAVTASADGRSFLSGDAAGVVKLWQTDRDQAQRTLVEADSPIRALALSPRGQRALVATEAGKLQLWDTASGRQLRTFREQQAAFHAVTYDSDGARALSAGAGDEPLVLWNATYGRAIGAFAPDESGPVEAVAFTPRGRHALAGTQSGAVKLWQLDRGHLALRLEGHRAEVVAVAVSPDGRRALTGARDGTLKLWPLDAEPEDDEPIEPLRRYLGHDRAVRGVAFSGDGARGVSVGEDRRLRLWQVD